MTAKTTFALSLAIVAATVGTTLAFSNTNTSEATLPPSSVIAVKNVATPTAPELLVKPISQVKASTSNVIYFDDTVTEETVDTAIAMLRKAAKHNKTVYLVLNSPGGSVFDGVRLISYMEANGNVITVCAQLCASMAAHIHQAGKERLMLSSGILMFHPASGGVQGQIEQMMSRLIMFKTQVDRLDAKIAKRSGIDYNEFKQRLAFEYWVLSPDAVQEHLAEGIISLDTGDADAPNGQSVKTEAAKKYPAPSPFGRVEQRPTVDIKLIN